MAGKKGMRIYTLEVKLEAVRMFFEEGETRAEIAKVLDLPSEALLKEWMRLYRREGEQAFTRPKGRPRKRWGEAARIQQLEMENALLKKYHTELRKSLLAKRDIGLFTTTGKNTK
jgi:transposase-like protein